MFEHGGATEDSVLEPSAGTVLHVGGTVAELATPAIGVGESCGDAADGEESGGERPSADNADSQPATTAQTAKRTTPAPAVVVAPAAVVAPTAVVAPAAAAAKSGSHGRDGGGEQASAPQVTKKFPGKFVAQTEGIHTNVTIEMGQELDAPQDISTDVVTEKAQQAVAVKSEGVVEQSTPVDTKDKVVVG